jgi:hypothetical protein
MLSLSMESNRVDVSLPSPEEGNRSSYRNVVFSINLEFRTVDKVRKLVNSICCTSLSEPLIF